MLQSSVPELAALCTATVTFLLQQFCSFFPDFAGTSVIVHEILVSPPKIVGDIQADSPVFRQSVAYCHGFVGKAWEEPARAAVKEIAPRQCGARRVLAAKGEAEDHSELAVMDENTGDEPVGNLLRKREGR